MKGMVMMMVIGVNMIIRVRLFLDSPPEMEEIVDRAGKLERAVGVVAVNIIGFVEKASKKRMVKKGNRYEESVRIIATIVFFLQTHLNCKPSFLYLHLLLIIIILLLHYHRKYIEEFN